ncbi:MAG: hypothetical protein J6K58_13795 [Lachnospiraceae bacterium]|nr:hypothetical protein [Lachnospiraceae bacterium]
MNSLTTIQKTFKVFQVLSKVAMIVSFVICGNALLYLLLIAIWHNGGGVTGADMETMMSLTGSSAIKQMIAALLSYAVYALTDGILFMYAFSYFRTEQKEGTPFTQNGADKLKSLGIKTIVMPIVAIVISAVIYECFSVANSGNQSNETSVMLGIMLILVSLVFRYGAELETITGGKNEN